MKVGLFRATLLLPLLLVVCSCRKDQYSGIYDIRGKIEFDDGRVASGAQVFLDDEFRTSAGSQGEFVISDVNAGRHRLKAVQSDSSGYSEAETEIDLKDGDFNLENFRLPVPVRMLEPVDVASRSLSLRWTASTAADFREYRIYIHHSSALDESTGTLLHIVTDRNDTIFEVNAGDFWWGGATLTPDTRYYFRVFVMNSFGRMSGSNIEEVVTSIWDHADEFTSSYRIRLESSFAALGNLKGIDWDGTCYWMLFFTSRGGYYDNNILTLVRYDHAEGTILDTIVFDGSNYFAGGIAWDGSQVWMSMRQSIQSVNIEEEAFGKSYHAGEGTVDLAWNGEDLVMLDTWNKVMVLDPRNGDIVSQFISPFIHVGYSGEKGVAARENEIWIINVWHDEIAICDISGKHIGVAKVDFMQQGFDSDGHDMPMCFRGERLVIALDSEVRIYTIEHI